MGDIARLSELITQDCNNMNFLIAEYLLCVFVLLIVLADGSFQIKPASILTLEV